MSKLGEGGGRRTVVALDLSGRCTYYAQAAYLMAQWLNANCYGDIAERAYKDAAAYEIQTRPPDATKVINVPSTP